MICSEATSLLDSMIDGELDSARATEVSEHLSGCDECNSVFGELKMLQNRVRGFLGKVPVSERFTCGNSLTITRRGGVTFTCSCI